MMQDKSINFTVWWIMFLNVYEVNVWSARLELKTVIIHKKYKITEEILMKIV